MVPTSDSETTVREFATLFADGAFADAADLLTEHGRTAVVASFPDEFREGSMDAEDALEQYRWGLYSQYGEFRTSEVCADDETRVVFGFESGSEAAIVEADADGITRLSFAPEYEVPAYVEESTFGERDVTIDTGGVALDGVLAVPNGTGPFPGVVLVHGAGIHDPGGTAGASKILKDLAWGLAAENVATLRYEKRLAEQEVPDENHTLDTVVVDDAVAAVDELAAVEEVSEDGVFVAGHSQGGMCAPRIAERHGGVAGIVNLDGLADPVLDPDELEFMRYEFEPDGILTEKQEAQLDADRETARRIAEGDFEDDEILWGKPWTWHHSTRGYDPVETASSLGRPVFVVRTGRADEGIQSELLAWLRGEFEKWRAAPLPDGSRVEFYERLDHFLQEGFAPTTPLGLYFGGNVSEVVVSDLVAWIRSVIQE